MARRVRQTEDEPEICQRIYSLGFRGTPASRNQSSAGIEPERIVFCARITEPIVISTIPGQAQSIDLAEHGQTVCWCISASATAVDHFYDLHYRRQSNLVLLRCQLTCQGMVLL